MLNTACMKLITNSVCLCSTKPQRTPKEFYKYLLRECEKLPNNGPRKFYKDSVKQSFKQHVNETDPERIQQIIDRAYEDTAWILKKYKKI